MTQTAKTILIGVLGFSALLATVGGAFALAKAANKRESPAEKQPSSSLVSSGSTESGASTSPAGSDASSSPDPATSSSNGELRDGPYITVDKSAMTLTVQYSDSELPFGYFTPTIHNPDPEDGQNAGIYLSICCPSDNTFLDWLDFWSTDENDHDTYAVSHGTGTAVGVIVRSGRRVKVKMKQKPPIAGGYQLKLRVYSPYYDSSVVRSFVDIDLRTVR